jgi:hypothetical protein
MDPANLARLRRFALAVGVILLTYAVAAVELDTGATVGPPGFNPLHLAGTQPPKVGPTLVLVFSFRRGKSSDAEESILGPADRAGLAAGGARGIGS